MDLIKEKYTMSEVCNLVQINAHQIRNWEKELDISFSRDNRNRRFFTKKDIDILYIVKGGIEKSLSLSEIRKQLIKNGMVAEQSENALLQMDIRNLTPIEFKEIASDIFKDIIVEREEQLKQDFVDKLTEQLSQQKKDLQAQFEKQSELHTMKLESKIREQIKSENEKLITYISMAREEDNKKSFWAKLFKK